MINVITFGTFDLFHYGHLKILERAKSLGDNLIVGVSSDALTYAKKNKYPIYEEQHRLEIIKAIQYVDAGFFEHSLEEKKNYLVKYAANILVMGDDWEGKFDHLNDICEIIYLPRTEDISTTNTIQSISG